MKPKILISLFVVVFAGLTSVANAAVTIHFDSTECPSCTSMIPVGGGEWSTLGLTVSNASWYSDSRDTFDTMGLTVTSATSPAVISLAAVSTDVTFDYWVIGGFIGTYEAFDSTHSSLGSLLVDATGRSDLLGAFTFTGSVASLEWRGASSQISTLTVSAVPIPEPETYAMLLAGLGLLGFAARRRQQNA